MQFICRTVACLIHYLATQVSQAAAELTGRHLLMKVTLNSPGRPCLLSLSLMWAPFHCVEVYFTNNLHCYCPSNLDDDEGQSLAGSHTSSEAAASCSCAPLASPFKEAGKNKMTEARTNECHQAVTKFVVKGLHPFATVDASEFR